MLTHLRFVIWCVLAIAAHGLHAAESLDQYIEQIFGEKKLFDAKSFGPAEWQDDGVSFTKVEPSPEIKGAKDIVRYEVESGKSEVLVTAAQLTPATPGAKPLAITSYAWSKNGRWLLIFTNPQKVWRHKTRGDYWLLDRVSGKLQQLGNKAPAASLMFAKFSPDSTRVAYVRESNLYVTDLSSGRTTQLTNDGSKTVINGTADWVNEEELAIRDGFRWSEDSRNLAYWQFDTTGVQDFTLIKTTSEIYPTLTHFPYPKAGTQNSSVRIGVVPVSGGRTRWMSLPGDPREHYIARLSWAKGSADVVIHQLNRRQNQLDIYVANSRTGKASLLFHDQDNAWVSVREQSLWTKDGSTLLILSERDGWQHAYAVSRVDQQVRLLTNVPADVVSLVGTDENDEWLYYMASPDNATQRFLFRARLDGTGKSERVSPAEQAGTHAHVLSPNGRYSFHTYSTFGQPPITALVKLPTHEVIRMLEENDALRSKIEPLARPTEFFQVSAGEGVTLDGWMIRPKDFDASKRYPLIVFIYGEPANVTVTDAWNGSRVLFHWALADAGYVIVSLDNRGTPAPRGREWRKTIYGNVNEYAVREQTVAIKNLLKERPYLDGSRVGAWGHSGGGSNTLNLLFRSPDTFHVGIAIAPVTDQRMYDTIYQERYMGLPAENAEGYQKGAPIAYAEGLKGKLLLIHGGADDNVHYQNSERLINRLVELQKPFDFMVYPDGTHAIAEGKGYAAHRYRLMARFFQIHLPAGGRQSTAAD